MKKYVSYAIGVALVGALVPFIASADTVSDLQAQIQSLMSQIKSLQEQVRTIQHASSTLEHASTTAKREDDEDGDLRGDNQGRRCAAIVRNLTIGSRGDDVRELQKVLAMDPSIYVGTTTGYFGPLTAKGVMKFQIKFGIASSSDGSVGPLTRQFFAKQCPPPPGLMKMREGEMMASSTRMLPPNAPRGDR